MGHVRFTFLTVMVFSLTTAMLYADEKPKAREPLQVLADCIEAVEAGDFARYLGHLSTDEQKLQTGYILHMSRTMSRRIDLGPTYADPEGLLLARTMRDLVKKHTVPESDRRAEHHAAEKTLAQLAGERPPEYPSPIVPHFQPGQIIVSASREQRMKIVDVLKDPSDFLVEALAELARPTNISGEQVSKSNTVVNVDEFIKNAKGLKWTLYTRGDYAVAVAIQPKAATHTGPYSPGIVAWAQPHVEFQRIDGRWKITGLLPASAMNLGNRMATVKPYTPGYGTPRNLVTGQPFANSAGYYSP